MSCWINLDYDSLGEDLPERVGPWTKQARPWLASEGDGWAPPPAADATEVRRYPPPLIQRPLVLVGGFAANGLHKIDREGGASYLGQQVWPPFHFNTGSGDWHLHGVAEVNQAGLLPTDLVIGQYEPLLHFLQQEMGYTPGRDFFFFPYRWTDSNLNSGRRLAGFLHKVVSKYPWNDGQEQLCDVICHSMGGLASRAAGLIFNAPLARVVYLACPFFGAGKGYFNLHPAHVVQVVDNMLLNRIIDRLAPEGHPLFGNSTALSECFQKMDSLFEMLPDRIGFQRGLCPVGIRRTLSQLPRPLESWQDVYLNEAFSAFPEPLQPQVQRAMEFKERLSSDMPGTVFVTIYSAAHATVGRVDLAFEFSRFALFGIPYDAAGGGDGSVPAVSGCGPGPAIEVHGRHLAVPNHRSTFYWISRFLNGTAV